MDKIEDLRGLLGTVVSNTKAAMSGKEEKSAREQRAIRRVLKHLLGREPEEAEMQLAQNF